VSYKEDVTYRAPDPINQPLIPADGKHPPARCLVPCELLCCPSRAGNWIFPCYLFHFSADWKPGVYQTGSRCNRYFNVLSIHWTGSNKIKTRRAASKRRCTVQEVFCFSFPPTPRLRSPMQISWFWATHPRPGAE